MKGLDIMKYYIIKFAFGRFSYYNHNLTATKKHFTGDKVSLVKFSNEEEAVAEIKKMNPKSYEEFFIEKTF